jgi:hypothetical protein
MEDATKLKEILETQDLGGIDKVVELTMQGDTEEISDLLTRYICEKYRDSDDMDDFKSVMSYTFDQIRNVRKIL